MQKERQVKIAADKERQAQAREKSNQTKLRNAAEKAALEAQTTASQSKSYQHGEFTGNEPSHAQGTVDSSDVEQTHDNHTNGFYSGHNDSYMPQGMMATQGTHTASVSASAESSRQ